MFEVEVNTAVPALPTPVPALPLSAAMLLGLLLLWCGAARVRMRDRTDIARGRVSQTTVYDTC